MLQLLQNSVQSSEVQDAALIQRAELIVADGAPRIQSLFPENANSVIYMQARWQYAYNFQILGCS